MKKPQTKDDGLWSICCRRYASIHFYQFVWYFLPFQEFSFTFCFPRIWRGNCFARIPFRFRRFWWFWLLGFCISSVSVWCHTIIIMGDIGWVLGFMVCVFFFFLSLVRNSTFGPFRFHWKAFKWLLQLVPKHVSTNTITCLCGRLLMRMHLSVIKSTQNIINQHWIPASMLRF